MHDCWIGTIAYGCNGNATLAELFSASIQRVTVRIRLGSLGNSGKFQGNKEISLKEKNSFLMNLTESPQDLTITSVSQ